VIDDFTQWYVGAAPDIGAYEGENRVWGPPFRYEVSPSGPTYEERPRIVRCFAYGRQLAVFFSTVIVPSVADSDLKISVGGQALTVTSIRFPGHQRTMTLDLDRPLSDGEVLELAFRKLPVGVNGETATMWGADLVVVGIPDGATLVGETRTAFSS
jgi:hypothetical protein